MKKEINKRMILKGKNPCILTLSGTGTTHVTTEWLREPSEEKLYLFASPEVYGVLCGEEIRFAPEKITAAALGEGFQTKGQFGMFDWQKARENLRIQECFEKQPLNNNALHAETAPTKPRGLSAGGEEKQAPGDGMIQEAPVPKPQRCCQCAQGEQLKGSPFPKEFPESVWYRYDYSSPAGDWHYMTGTVFREGKPVSFVTAVPGKYSMKPPAWLKEFSVYLQSVPSGQGYWIAVSPFMSTNLTED